MNPKKDKLKKIANYSGLGIQVMVMIGGGAWLGSWLDERAGNVKSWYTMGFVIGFTALSIWYAVRKLNELNES